MVLKAGSFTRSVAWLTRVYIKNEQLRLILKFTESKTKKHMQNEKIMVPEKMDPHYSSWGLS
jgi:hypothetical protein